MCICIKSLVRGCSDKNCIYNSKTFYNCYYCKSIKKTTFPCISDNKIIYSCLDCDPTFKAKK